MSTGPVDEHAWGDSTELFGPRHAFRESLLLREIDRRGAPGRDALDAGAGAGSMSLALARRGYRVTAVDGSEGFAEHLGGVLDGAPGGPHRAARGDMTALPVADASADLVVCAEVLEHLDDDAGAARELRRACRPGALVVVSVPAGPFRYDWTDRWAGHRRRYTPEGLEALLAGAGLVGVDAYAWGFPVTGFYHRHVYRPALRRRLVRGGGDATMDAPPALAGRVLRAALSLDRLFLGRRPGYLGLIATARAPG